ncbi:MAG: hypothetical protein J5879_09430 [Clostridia bacterium]|nr:hypothetical protein [Clostridia bacterium]
MRARYVFEHVMTPYLLDRRGGDFVSVLMIQKHQLLYKLCASAYAQEQEEFTYTESDFGFEAARLDEKTVCMTLKMPDPELPGDCKYIYVLSDAEPFKASFFTVELDDEDGLMLCGQSGDVHFTFGKYDDEKKALALMLGVHRDTEN